MTFKILFTSTAKERLQALHSSPGYAKRLKAVQKCIGLLESNPRHPGLHAHEYDSLEGPFGEKVFEAYAENRTPGAYRVFWYYGPDSGQITILDITPHP